MAERSPHACPRCANPMSVVRDDKLVVHRCQACGGSWLDWPDAVRALRGWLGVATRKVVRRIDTSAEVVAKAGYRDASTGHEDIRACPSCRAPVARMQTSLAEHGVAVEVDMCRAHGVWFDSTELTRVVERAAAQAGKPPLD